MGKQENKTLIGKIRGQVSYSVLVEHLDMLIAILVDFYNYYFTV
jgi:hypothetical protein